MEGEFRYGNPSRWEKYFRDKEGISISETTIRERINSDGNVKFKKIHDTVRNKVDIVFAEAGVRRVCADLLIKHLPQADENGFFIEGGIRFGTCYAWAKIFNLDNKAIGDRLEKNKIQPKKGKIFHNGKLHDFYSETEVRRTCDDLINLPQADEDGFFVKKGERFGVPDAWGRLLNLDGQTVQTRLDKIRAQPVDGRLSVGRVSKFFYSEADVREACANLLEGLPQADEDGFFIKKGVRFGCVSALARLLGIAGTTIQKYVERIGCKPVEGILSSGHKFNFYSEADVREACAELLKDLPQADEDGFFIKNSINYGNCSAWARSLNLQLATLINRVEKMGANSINGRLQDGQVVAFYTEADVRKACGELLKDLPQADQDGFFMEDNIRYGTHRAWAKFFNLVKITVNLRLKKIGAVAKRGRSSNGRPSNFYSEPEVRKACADLISKK